MSDQRVNDKNSLGLDEKSPQLSQEDKARVEQYLSSPIHSVERKPFKPFLMMLGLVAVVGMLSVASILISWLVLE